MPLIRTEIALKHETVMDAMRQSPEHFDIAIARLVGAVAACINEEKLRISLKPVDGQYVHWFWCSYASDEDAIVSKLRWDGE